MYRSCPTSSSEADRRSGVHGLNVVLLMTTLLAYSPDHVEVYRLHRSTSKCIIIPAAAIWGSPNVEVSDTDKERSA
jgi:hypothetical protein